MILQIDLSERVQVQLEVTHYEFEKSEDWRDGWYWDGEVVEITLQFSALPTMCIENPNEDQLQEVFDVVDLDEEYVDSVINDFVIKYLDEM